MARAAPLVNLFNGGELSRLLAARSDVARFAGGCYRLENFVGVVEGPAVRRPGFRDVAAAKSDTARSWISPMVFNATDAYALEWGDGTLRFFANDGQIVSHGAPYEIGTPYRSADLVTPEGTFGLSWHGEGDVLYLAQRDGGSQPYTLNRGGALNWFLDPYEAVGGPWRDFDLTDAAITPGGTSGTITLNADRDTFEDGHVDVMIRLWLGPLTSVKAWEPGKAVVAGDRRYADGKYYEAQFDGTTGTLTPTHDEGVRSDGGVAWLYLHSGYGWAQVSAVVNPRRATVFVLSALPQEVVDNGTRKWQWGSWGGMFGYPNAVDAAYGRLVWAQGRVLQFSAPDDFDNHEDHKSGRILPDDGFTLAIRAAVQIRWLSRVNEQLVVGTDRGEWLVRKMTDTEPFGPANCDATPLTEFGCRALDPVQAWGRNLFVDRGGRRLYEQSGQIRPDGVAGVQALERSKMAREVLSPGIVAMAWQQRPFSVLWLALADGTLRGFTYDPDDECFAFHRHPLGAGALVESVAVIPRLDGDQLWAVLTLGGLRRVARLGAFWSYGGDPGDAFFTDLGVDYAGPPIAGLAGLGHLEGRGVALLLDGAVQPHQVVTGGVVTFLRPAAKASVGLPFTSLVEKRNLEAGAAGGTAQTRVKRFGKVAVRLLESGNVELGPDEARLVLLDRRPDSVPFGAPWPLITDDVVLQPWPGGYSRPNAAVVRCQEARPCTVLALVPDVEVAEG
jgi:hypothetical protein